MSQSFNTGEIGDLSSIDTGSSSLHEVEKKKKESTLSKPSQGEESLKGGRLYRWLLRNIVHVALLTAAVLSMVGTIIGSLGSCSSSLENVTMTNTVTVTRTVSTNVTTNETVTEITPLTTFVLLDASNSMAWSTDGQVSKVCPSSATCQGTNYKYIVSDGNTAGEINSRTRFSCQLNSDGDRVNAVMSTCNGTTPTAVTAASWYYNASAEGDRFDKAKIALPTILNALNESLNNNSDSNLRTGIIQWAHNDRGVIIQSDLTSTLSTTLAANDEMVINGGGATCWAPGLCQCYEKIKNDAQSVNASRLCILVSDGGLYPNGSPGQCGYEDKTYDDSTGSGVRFKNSSLIPGTSGFCKGLYQDWTSEGNTGKMSHKDVSDFLKAQNFRILGILARTSAGTSAKQNMFYTSSCEGYDYNTNRDDCPYYQKVNNFTVLANRASDIAAYQLARAQQQTTKTVSETITEAVTETSTEESVVSSSVSVCDKTFLYALAAFVPFLGYLVYRIVTILAKRRTMKVKILGMMKDADNISKWGVAGTTTRALLPNALPNDIDFGITWLLFSCFPCILPVSHDEFEVHAATTFAL